MAARMEMCFVGESRGKTGVRGRAKKTDAIYLEFLPPQPESFSSHLSTFKVSELGYTRGCYDFTAREQRPCTRGVSTVVVCPAHLLLLLEFLDTGFCMFASSGCSLAHRTLSLKPIIFVPPEKNKINRKHCRTYVSGFLGGCACYMLSYPFAQLKEEIRKSA